MQDLEVASVFQRGSLDLGDPLHDRTRLNAYPFSSRKPRTSGFTVRAMLSSFHGLPELGVGKIAGDMEE